MAQTTTGGPPEPIKGMKEIKAPVSRAEQPIIEDMQARLGRKLKLDNPASRKRLVRRGLRLVCKELGIDWTNTTD